MMDSNSVSPMPDTAPIAEFDKSPPTPPEETLPMDDLPPPPGSAGSFHGDDTKENGLTNVDAFGLQRLNKDGYSPHKTEAMRQTITEQILASAAETIDNVADNFLIDNNTIESDNAENNIIDNGNIENTDTKNHNIANNHTRNGENNEDITKPAESIQPDKNVQIMIEKDKANEIDKKRKSKSKSYNIDEIKSKRKVKKTDGKKPVKQEDNIGNESSLTDCILKLLGWKKCDESRYDDENEWGCTNWCEYVVVVVLAALLLIASLTLTLFWIMYYREGFSWDTNPKLQFNLHPVLMVAGFITFSGFSILLYRICRCFRRIYVKLIHTIFHALAIPCIVVGFLAVLEYHNNSSPPIPNFYSMHSWLGFVTMGLFALQFVFGFFSFLILLCCEGATAAFRASMVPIHASFGLTTFMLAIATCLTGLTEKAIFTLGSSYGKLPEEAIIMNSIAMVLISLAIVVVYICMREDFRFRGHVLIRSGDL